MPDFQSPPFLSLSLATLARVQFLSLFYSPRFLLLRISERPRLIVYLPQLSATVISLGYFCPYTRAASITTVAACCCRMYFSINYAAAYIREPYPNDLTADYDS